MQTKTPDSAPSPRPSSRRRLVLARLAGLAGLGAASGGLWIPRTALASAKPDWAPAAAWQGLLSQLTTTKGLSIRDALASLESLQRQDRAIALVNPPPDAPVIPRSLNRVLGKNLDARTLADGRAFMANHRSTLEQAQAKFGVPASVICGILGVETRFGRIQGSFPARDTLASLALLSPRRPEFFAKELVELLLLTQQTPLDLRGLQGSFAGALGMPQFMPSSWRQYAVDFEGDGRIDLIKSPADAIGSVANFLVQHGWKRDWPTHLIVPSDIRQALKVRQRAALDPLVVTRLTAEHQLSAIRQSPLGAWVELSDAWRQQPATMPASLVHLPEPEAPDAHLWLASPNFFAITHYNRSYVYAGSVLSLAAALENPDSPPLPRG